MAISNIRTAPGGASVNSVNLELATGSGTNRIVVALVGQKRTTLDAGVATYNGVSGTLAVADTVDPGLWIYFWLDADLPASSGTYTLAVTGTTTVLSISGFSCSGAAQTGPSDTDSVANTTTSQSVNMTLTAGGVALAVGMAAADATAYADQVTILASTLNGATYRHYAFYDVVDGLVGCTHTTAIDNIVGAVFDAAASSPTITDVDTDETIVPGQTGVVATGTNLSDGASARWVDANGNVLTMANYSAHATAPTFDVPSLATTLAAGVKFGSGDFEIWSA